MGDSVPRAPQHRARALWDGGRNPLGLPAHSCTPVAGAAPRGLGAGGLRQAWSGTGTAGDGGPCPPCCPLPAGGRRALGQTGLLPVAAAGGEPAPGRAGSCLRPCLLAGTSPVPGHWPRAPRAASAKPNGARPGPLPPAEAGRPPHATERGEQGLSTRVGHAHASAGTRVRATPPPHPAFPPRRGWAGTPGGPWAAPGARERGRGEMLLLPAGREPPAQPSWGGVACPRGLRAWETADVIQTSCGLLPPCPQ